MSDTIYDPISDYSNIFRDKFREIAESTFKVLAEEGHIDATANKETCTRLYKVQDSLVNTKRRIKWRTFLCVLLWLCVAGGITASCVLYGKIEQQFIFAIGASSLLMLIVLLAAVHPSLKKLKHIRKHLSAMAADLEQTAWEQMSGVNRLYDWDILTRMMSRAIPKIKFDPYFTVQRLADLQMTYGWDGSFNDGRSVIYSRSGLINGNPFVFCRTRKMEMGMKTYYGTKTIYWTTVETGSDGKSTTVRHSETLTASYTAPYPEYYEKTRLIYGNTAAPDLVFSRRISGLAEKKHSLAFRKKRRALRKKARDLKGSDFAMMTNEDFEVLFDTSDRNNNQQFALLFTPLAQDNIIKLLSDRQTGYGDDFDFIKNKMINIIVPEHLQSLNIDLGPKEFKSLDFEKAKTHFMNVNEECFRALYFSLAPLFCVPMYQQIRPRKDIYGIDMPMHSSFWEHESLANFWGEVHFRHPQCVTPCILKTQPEKTYGDSSLIKVTAYGYKATRQLTYVSVWGSDGRSHDVPVYWDQYDPVVGTGELRIREDNNWPDDSASFSERSRHEMEMLSSSQMTAYRRHIASSL